MYTEYAIPDFVLWEVISTPDSLTPSLRDFCRFSVERGFSSNIRHITMYNFLMGPVNILGLCFRTVRLLWGKYKGWSVRIVNFQFFPHKRSLRDFSEFPGLFEELLPFLLVIQALKGRAVVLEGTGVAGPAVGAVFW
jgi:hypothetical protein